MKPLVILFKNQLTRESILLFRQLKYIVNSSLFFFMIMIFFPLTMPPDGLLLRTIAPGLVWMGLLLSLLLSADRLFQQDYEEGTLEQWLVSGHPMSVFVLAKLIIHWLFILMPMLVMAPIIAFLFGLSWNATWVLMLSLMAGSPAILFLCALAAVFSIGLRQKGVLMALILLPLTIPVLIFGSGSITAAMQGMNASGYIALLAAMSLLCISLLPSAIAAMIKFSLD